MTKSFTYRLFEILPGVVTWGTFVLPILFAFIWPKAVAIVVMIYALYWFMRTVMMSYRLIFGYRHYRQAVARHWLDELKAAYPKTWTNVTHLMLIAMYKEEYPTLEATFQALCQSDYPLENCVVVLCTEERAGAEAQAIAKKLSQAYQSKFKDFFISIHPANTPGEVKGKGANISYAAKQVVPKLLHKGLKVSDILVTTLDADNRVDRQYLPCVTKAFLESSNPAHSSYQPMPMYFNNIWNVPFFVRMIALGSSFWHLIEATRQDHLRNFSAHSQSLAGLIETDYWSVTTIVEDGHQYWRSFYAFKGDYTVIPIFVPIYQDAVLSHSTWETIKEVYLQQRRWAWGATDIAYAYCQNAHDRKISLVEKWVQFFRLFEGNYTWSTTSIVLAIGAWPPLLINATFQKTVFAYNFPSFYSSLLFIAGIGMIVALVISTLILPPPPHQGRQRKIRRVLDWVLTPLLLPFTNIAFGALPAIDAQTRLMLGHYLEFHVTAKKAVDDKPALATTH